MQVYGVFWMDLYVISKCAYVYFSHMVSSCSITIYGADVPFSTKGLHPFDKVNCLYVMGVFCTLHASPFVCRFLHLHHIFFTALAFSQVLESRCVSSPSFCSQCYYSRFRNSLLGICTESADRVWGNLHLCFILFLSIVFQDFLKAQ